MSPEQAQGAELDGRSDLFSVGTLLYILTTGKKPFDGATDLDILVQVRKARYEKPSTFIKDFNPEVERVIARAMRADLARRWQSADQMADKLDGILVKLGQPSGPAAVKRWLETLSAKDGVKAPAELQEAANQKTGTIELGSADFELQHVQPPPESPDDEPERRPPPARPATRAATGKSARAPVVRDDAATRLDPPALPLVTFTEPAPSVMVRFGRWLRRLILRTVLAAVLLGAIVGVGGYYARPYLPSWVVHPVETWLRQLPPPLGEGDKPIPPAPPRPR